ncbi:MAG: tetratricopeptide repeat protein [Leptolyngbya sp. SIO1E4]|nr:tetratricopeptide repeat protein [Leptolyngbya sp. SIO1E4]
MTVLLGAIPIVIDFIQRVQGNTDSTTTLWLALGAGLLWVMCGYYARFWNPALNDARLKTPTRFLAATPWKRTRAQLKNREQVQAQREQWRKHIRRYATVGCIVIPLFILAGCSHWLPFQPSSNQAVVILVADFDGADEQNDDVTETILSELRDATQDYSDVQIKALNQTITEAEGSDVARTLGDKGKADLLIWGWFSKPQEFMSVRVNFEMLQPPKDLPQLQATADDNRLVGNIQINKQTILEFASTPWPMEIQLPSEIGYFKLFCAGIARYLAADWQGAISYLGSAVEHVQEPPERLNLSTAFLYQGRAYLLISAYEDAIAAYDAALQRQPEFPSALTSKGYALFQLGRYEEAITTLNTALSIQPEFPLALNNKGYALLQLGRYEEAITTFNAALAISPNDLDALNNKGAALITGGRYQEAITTLDTALSIQPEDPEALNNKGLALNHLNRYEESIALFDAALNLKPDSYVALSNKGSALLNLGRLEAAISAFDAALNIKSDLPLAIHDKGVALGQLGRHEEALAAFDSALEIQPDLLDALENKGVSLMILGRYEEALNTVNAALKIQPDLHTSLDQKGHTLLLLGRYEEALTAFNAALDVDPNYPGALYRKAIALAHLGQQDEALKQLTKAFALEASFQNAAQTDPGLDVLREDPRFQALINLNLQ